MRRVALLLALLLALTAVGCGSRVDDADDGGGGGGDDLEAEGEGGGSEEEEAANDDLTPESEELGTIPNPCSGEPAEGELPADTPGVTEDTIRIGVISDRENPAVPLPTVGIEEAVKAFVEFCNEAGGINGRTLELETYDSMITATDDVTKQACADDLFALVGTGSVQDQLGIETREGCGLVEVAGYSATSARAGSEDFFTGVPGLSPTDYNVGPCLWMAEQHPDAVKKVAMLYTDLPAASVRGQQVVEGCSSEAGFEYVVEEALPFGETNFGPIVEQMQEQGVEMFQMVSATSETLAVLREAETQGLELEVIDLGQQYYDANFATEPVAEGAYVLSNTAPFSEADSNPTLRLYQEYLDKVGGVQSTLGVQAFSAGLLFATATDALGAEVTREGLVTELQGITEWDGGGLNLVGSPGTNETIDCFLYLRVEGGEFVREHPEEGYDCDPAYIHTSDERFES
ncbi:ABC transporter substrate-binding protein [Iamia sp. SCSIO 61187]|uniref:ABC transporter substrate-binding protein n=1 Tax=Iamia sp. SCSIO 61187 TaxID=2722752 RepID=UPI001C6284E9|nr:ABC transporter substrate-binding protein [Iamia sp. SCSIO 61187]QYG94134.1 ABC transporter substrate-binding protein [Iamia sp. SCSIO 61187]